MIYDGLDFHNVAELREVDGSAGLRLQRVPEHVRAQLNEGTAGVMLSPANSEIRFRIAEGQDAATITLSSDCPATIYTYYGPFEGPSWELGKEPCEIRIAPHKRIRQLTSEAYASTLFDPGLVRLCFGGAYPEPVFYHGHDGNVALPREGDTPAVRYLAYGSSIAHGTARAGAALSYPAHAAWRVGMDLRNLGASGCCLCEPALADYLAEQPCDVVTLELSVNMLGGTFSAAEFRERAGYLVKRIADADPRRQVVCITIFPHFRDIGEQFCEDTLKSTPGEFRQILRDIVADLSRPNITLVEGPELLPDIEALSMDLIHPGARGMIQIGEALAQRLKPLVPAH